MRAASEPVGATSETAEPIAIIGMACRFPGAPSLDAYWDLLEEGRSGITESIPGSGIGRPGQIFDDAEGARAACRFGGFLDDIDLFDPTFFRLSPVEAQLMDPQQRLMLETSWRALEDAGLSDDRLQGTRTGVYTGVSNTEYRNIVMGALEESGERTTTAIALYANTGTGLNGASGRISYLLGLEGPALALDTACSSSMVAMHEATRALGIGEIDIALVGGVNVILDPGRFESFSAAGMLSPDGQCRGFDASANGWVRGEGCAVVVLKRLDDAVADGDRIWSVVRGSALSHDGAGAHYTAPNPAGQQRVMEAALRSAGIAPADVDYVEAHGTGTIVGDPVEVIALGAVYSEGRHPDQPLLIGSAKSNIGHLEPAAGLAGMIKTVLAMQRGVIPRHLHFDTPNPDIDWDLPVRVAAHATPWPNPPGRPPLAGVSSYGISGTNSHIILEGYQAPATPARGHDRWVSGSASRVTVSLPEPFADLRAPGEEAEPRPTRVLPLSAKNEPALRELAGRYASWIEDREATETAITDMAWTASAARSHFNHRAALPFSNLDALRGQLTELAGGGAAPTPRTARKVAFAYSGQGGQWVGMGRELYETEPVARAVMDRCEAVHREVTGEPLLDVMFGRGGADGDLDESEWTQPALYVIDVALTALWASVGVQPDAVIGHSFGELPAAQAAGVFSIEDGMRLAIARGRLMAQTEPGAMAAIFAPRDQVESVIEEVNAASERALLGIAVDNGVNQTVGGLADEVDAISERFEADEVRVRRLAISVVGHSALLEPVLPDLQAFADGIAISAPDVDFITNVTGEVLESETALDGAYWSRHARRPVAFADGVATLERLGVDTVIEIGPHAVLGPMVSMLWSDPPGTPGAAAVIPSMLRPAERGGTEAEAGFVEAVAAAYEAGLDVLFEGLFEGEERRRVSVPGYPFQLSSYWVETPRRRRSDLGHPLLGTRHESHRGEVSFDTEVTASEPAWLSDHRVFGRVVAPGALYGAMAAAALLAEEPGPAVIGDMQIHSPLIFPEKPADDDDVSVPLQLVMEPPSGGSRRLEIFSRQSGADWTLHVDGRVTGADIPAADPLDMASVKAGMTRGNPQELYRARSSTGVELGPTFRGLTAIWEGPGEALGEIELPSDVERSGVAVHPLLLDACFQVVAGARGAIEEGTTAYMPFGWERLWLTGSLPERLVCVARMRGDAPSAAAAAAAAAPEVLKADIWIYDEDGAPIGGVSGYTAKRATRAALLSSIDAIDDLLYEVVWRDRPYAAPAANVTADPPGVWVLAADQIGATTHVAAGLIARNQTVVIAGAGKPDDGLPPGMTAVQVEPLNKASWRSMLEELPEDTPLRGVVHLVATGGHGFDATTDEMKVDVTRASASALALVQALADVDAAPELGVRFVTRGGQVVAQNRDGALAGAMLWGFGKVVARELPDLQARVADLDPADEELPDTFIDELLSPDRETLVAYRAGGRLAPRLVRGALGTPQFGLPEDGDWHLRQDDSGAFHIEPAGQREPGSEDVRIAVEAAVPGSADADFSVVSGRVIESGSDVTRVALGDRVVGFTRDPLGPTLLMRAEFVTVAPAETSAAAIAAGIAEDLAAGQPALSGEHDPARASVVLADLMSRIHDGASTSRLASRWPMAQVADALEHGGVVSTSPIATGRLREDRTYLVTGGLGGIGGAVAGWLADRGASHIVLNGRRAPDPPAEEVIRALEDRGVTVQVEITDVAQPTALRAMLQRIDATLPPLAGVIHSAGGVSDAALGNQDWDRFEEIVWTKVLGGWELHRATEHRDLDLFILFSSMSGVRGTPGQANYSSANAFLDQLALHRRARGLPGQTVQWGAWMGVGAAERQRDRIESSLLASGADWMTPQQGVRALDRLVRQDLAVGAVTSMDWSAFAAGLRSVPPLIEELLTAASDDLDEADEPGDDLVARVREAPEGERHGILVAFVQDLLQALLRLRSRPASNVAFFELGIDSLMALELRARLNDALGGVYTASNTVAFDYPNADDLATHLVGALQAAGDEQPAQPVIAPGAPASSRTAVAEDAIAIVGMACRFPGADDLSAYWRLLDAAASGVSEQRNGADSWSGIQGDAAAGERLHRQGAYVDGIDQFDASFFRISPVEARSMDPQLRLLLETSWHALEDAGLDPAQLRGSRSGFYAGIGLSEYQDTMGAQGTAITYPGVNGGLGIGRVAFALGVEGPALPFEVACASSLVALHNAAGALRQGEVDVALAGGVNAALSQQATQGMAEFGMLSSTGQCRTFDAGADGHVRGEGCGIVILKRLDDAVADGDRIWAVIRGSAVNQNSAGASPTAPNGLAQRRVIEDAIAAAQITPADVDYLEAHGVASGLGDAIELEAAAAVYGQDRDPDQPLLVGSVKTNIGHLESASGVASLIKVVLSMQRGVIPAQLHFENPSTHLDWDSLPLHVTSAATPWPERADRVPIAGVSAFGLFGTNAHVVVEGAAPPAGNASDDAFRVHGAPRLIGASSDGSSGDLNARPTRLLPLSGRTDAALRDLARSYLSWVDRYAGEESASELIDATLADAAWTAGAGRRHFAHRAAVLFDGSESLLDGLRAVADANDVSQQSPADRVAFAYGSDVGRWPALTRSLYETEPVVRAVLNRCDGAFEAETGQSLRPQLIGDEETRGGAEGTDWSVAADYAVQCALSALWASVGVQPAVVAGGGGAGELAAAHAAGVFDLETGMRLAVALDRLPASTGNSAAPDGALAEIEAALGDATPSRPSVTLLSGADARAAGADEPFDAAYWLRHAQPSALRVDALTEAGVDVVVEIGEAESRADGAVFVVPGVLRADTADPRDEFARSVARVYELGADIAFEGLFAGESRRRVALPSYPFQRRRFWMEPRSTSGATGV